MCVQNSNIAALAVPEIIGGARKNWAVPGYVHAFFSPKLFMGFCSDGHCYCSCYCSHTRSCDNSDWSFDWGGNPNLGEGEAVGGWDGTV